MRAGPINQEAKTDGRKFFFFFKCFDLWISFDTLLVKNEEECLFRKEKFASLFFIKVDDNFIVPVGQWGL